MPPQAPTRQTWQPIATAPKDGTRVLFWSSGTGYWPIIGRWIHGTPHAMGYFGFDSPMVGEPEYWRPLPVDPDEENTSGPCIWRQDEDGAWSSSCLYYQGLTFEFNAEFHDATPCGHRFDYCPYCGRRLSQAPYEGSTP